MGRRLESSRFKLERARHHFTEAEGLEKAFLDGSGENGLRPFYLKTEYEPQHGYYSVRFDLVRTAPVGLSLAVGDCAHNLRAALDHLAWEIVPAAFRNNPANEKKVRDISFPITGNPNNWSSLVGLKVPGISNQQKNVLQSHQPFNAPAGVGSWQPLSALTLIDNTDKHRLVLPTVVRVDGPIEIENMFVTGPPVLEGFQPQRIERLYEGRDTIAKNGLEVARVHGIRLLGQELPHIGVTSDTPSYVGFEDGHPLLDGLKSMMDAVETVISDMEANL
jgi:hypothetical protein